MMTATEVECASVNKPFPKITDKDHTFQWFFETSHGKMFHGDSYQFVSKLNARSVDLIVTSHLSALSAKRSTATSLRMTISIGFVPMRHNFTGC